MIYGPKDDGTYVVEFRTAETAGEALIVRHEQPIRQTLLEMPDHAARPRRRGDRMAACGLALIHKSQS
jgi:hypothetical protein